jgi:Domain of unknown function (DUF4342)
MTKTPLVEPVVEPKEPKGYREVFMVPSEQMFAKVKELYHESTVRHIVIKHEGKIVMEFPVSVGLMTAFMVPQLAAVGAISALFTNFTIEVVRVEEPMPTM